jgi:hypothetical protein
MSGNQIERENRELAASLGTLAERRRRNQKEHPSSKNLNAYQSCQLSESQADEIRDHLEVCPECAGKLLEKEVSSDAEQCAEALLSQEQIDADFYELRDRLVAEGALTDQLEDPPKVARGPSTLTWALAASLFFCFIGMSSWVWLLRQDLDVYSGPLANFRIIDLVPIGEGIERSTRGPDTPTFPVDAPCVVLILNLSDACDYTEYEVEIHKVGKPEEKTVIRNLNRSEEGNFTLEIRRNAFPAGDYHLILHGGIEGKREILAEYLTEISYE